MKKQKKQLEKYKRRRINFYEECKNEYTLLGKERVHENGGSLPMFKSPEEMARKIDDYLLDCDDREVPPTVAGLAFALGCDRRTINNYKKRDNFFPLIKKALNFINQDHEERLTSGKSSSTAGTIFLMKNNFEYKDKLDHDITGSLSLGQILSSVFNPNDKKNIKEGEIIKDESLKKGESQGQHPQNDFFEIPPDENLPNFT